MTSSSTRVPAIEGWFTLNEDAPSLLGHRCGGCGTIFFPKGAPWCRNPACNGDDLAEVELSRRGRIWSYTSACYQPPAPYVAADPFVPFCIAAVELEAEQIVVIGQMVDGVGVDDLTVGDEVELVIDTLFTDGDTDHMVWKWRPVGGETEVQA